MPILTGTAPAATTPPTGGVTPPSYAADYWEWVTPAGAVRSLMNEHPYLRPGGVSGHMVAPVTLRESLPPGMSGGLYRGAKVMPRDVYLTMMAHTRDPIVWASTTRTLAADFDTTTTAGLLCVRRVDGSQRMLSCRYVTGLDSPVEGEPGVVKIGTFVVQLRAYDPWWYGPAVSRTFTVSDASNFWPTSGAPPFTITATELVGSGTPVNNPGDVEAFPVWTVQGPCDSVTFTSSGSSFTVNFSLNDGELLVVDCDPRVGPLSKITNGSGSNLWGVATGDYPDLWALPPGVSQVLVDVTGASSDTLVTLQFNPRFRTA